MNRLLSIFCLLAALVLPVAAPASAASPRSKPTAAAPSSACTASGLTLNAVVRYYLALDRHQYAAAYACLDPAMQALIPYSSYVSGYHANVASRLELVTEANAGGASPEAVQLWLQGVDQAIGGLLARQFTGSWQVNLMSRLGKAHIAVASAAVSMTILSTPTPADLFNQAKLIVLWHKRLSFGPRQSPIQVYDVSGQGCASCHGQMLYLYQAGRLIFAESNSDVNWARFTHGILTIKAGRSLDGFHLETWQLTPYGFVLNVSCAALRSADWQFNELVLPSDTFLPGSKRTSATALHSRVDLAANEVLIGMDQAFPSFGYVGGCKEFWTISGPGNIRAEVQTDVFANRAGGLKAYAWDNGLVSSDMLHLVMPVSAQLPNGQAEAVSFTDSTNKDPSLRGAWIEAHAQQGEVLMTIFLQAPSTDGSADQQLQSDFAYSQRALFGHLWGLALDTYS